MLKKIFKWLYLLVSGLCFLLVLAAFFLFIYAVNNEAEVKSFVNDFEEYRTHKNKVKETEDFVIESVEEEDPFITQEDFPNLKKGDEFLYSRGKIHLKTRNGGTLFLRRSQIVSITAGKPNHKLTTIKGETKEIHHREYSLDKLHDILNDEEEFFKTKKAIINCYYVEEIQSNRGVKKAIMENGQQIEIPDEKVTSFIRKLEVLNF